MSIVSRCLQRIGRIPELLPKKSASAAAKSGINRGTTLVITHAELSGRHGTGALLVRILRGENHLLALYSQEFFKTHDIDVAAVRVTHSLRAPGAGRTRIRRMLKAHSVQRILCVPFYQDDVRSALIAQKASGAPMALYLMDDQNIHVRGIPDILMRKLIDKSKVCFAISPALCSAYEEKYQRRFWFVPPVADPDHFVPPELEFRPNSPPRGILIGNLWSAQTLTQFWDAIRLSGLRIDWYGNAGKPFINLDPESLAQQGIILHSHVAEEILIQNARAADFAVIPAGTLDGNDTHDWLARASLPSRIVYLMAIANAPMIVMGHRETAAARFVTDLGLGTVCDYSTTSFRNAVAWVTDKTNSTAIRIRAKNLSPRFSSEGLSSWLWESLSQGRPTDNRFEGLLPPVSTINTG
jgi:hypothetical protein